ncbi:MAG TPA: ATP synthase F1 subunit epsilon [Actinomycetota bacterium]
MAATDAAMIVQVVTPDRQVVAAEDATFVLAHGIAGDVGILPGHAPLLIALGVGPLRVDAGERKTWMVVDGGFLQVSRNQVIILAEYAVLPAEVERAWVEREIREMEEALARQDDEEFRGRLNRAKAIEAVHGMLKM